MRRTFDLKIYFYFISPFLVCQFTLFLWEVKKLCSHIIDNFLFKNFNLSQARLITLLNHFNFFFLSTNSKFNDLICQEEWNAILYITKLFRAAVEKRHHHTRLTLFFIPKTFLLFFLNFFVKKYNEKWDEE